MGIAAVMDTGRESVTPACQKTLVCYQGNLCMKRRALLCISAGTLVGFAGCSALNPTNPTPTESGSPSPTPELADPRSYLPEPNDEWTLDRTASLEVAPLGGADGIRGYYTDSDSVEYEVIVFISTQDYNSAPGTAESFACAGWQVALVLDRVAVAASTGTDQRTFTPEAPPAMDQTPASDRVSDVRTLLSLSPRLTVDEIEASDVQCR